MKYQNENKYQLAVCLAFMMYAHQSFADNFSNAIGLSYGQTNYNNTDEESTFYLGSYVHYIDPVEIKDGPWVALPYLQHKSYAQFQGYKSKSTDTGDSYENNGLRAEYNHFIDDRISIGLNYSSSKYINKGSGFEYESKSTQPGVSIRYFVRDALSVDLAYSKQKSTYYNAPFPDFTANSKTITVTIMDIKPLQGSTFLGYNAGYAKSTGDFEYKYYFVNASYFTDVKTGIGLHYLKYLSDSSNSDSSTLGLAINKFINTTTSVALGYSIDKSDDSDRDSKDLSLGIEKRF